jgi:hypothetical protein
LSFTTVDPLSLQSRVLCLIHRRKPNVVPQFSPDLYAEIAGVCIYKTWRQISTATMAVNKPNASGTHLPSLLNFPTKGRSGCCVRVTGYVGRVISMQIDRDLGEHLKRSPSSLDQLSLNRKLLQRSGGATGNPRSRRRGKRNRSNGRIGRLAHLLPSDLVRCFSLRRWLRLPAQADIARFGKIKRRRGGRIKLRTALP